MLEASQAEHNLVAKKAFIAKKASQDALEDMKFANDDKLL